MYTHTHTQTRLNGFVHMQILYFFFFVNCNRWSSISKDYSLLFSSIIHLFCLNTVSEHKRFIVDILPWIFQSFSSPQWHWVYHQVYHFECQHVACRIWLWVVFNFLFFFFDFLFCLLSSSFTIYIKIEKRWYVCYYFKCIIIILGYWFDNNSLT